METAVKTQNKYQVSIDLLNDAVGKEIATSLQYMYFHTHFEDDRYQYLSKIMREISIAEMRHIEEFSDRIMFLQGDVDMNASFRTKQVTDAKEMLRLAMQLEQSTIDSYNEASRIAAEHKDAVTHKMFQDIIVEEEEHLDTFRTELQHMLDYGEEYLALQSAAGSKHTAKSFKHTDDGEYFLLPESAGALHAGPRFFNARAVFGPPCRQKTAAAAVRDDNFVSLCILIL
ncbi:MAG: ferritin-like domain-containing protein [Alistipes onderdonkii]